MKCADVYNVFFDPGEVVEIRAFGLSKSNPAWEGWAGGAGVVYGYFDNAADFGKCAEALDKAKAGGIYFTLNPVNPDILARAVNRLKAADMKTNTTQDKEILCLAKWAVEIEKHYNRPQDIEWAKDGDTGDLFIVQSRPETVHAVQKVGVLEEYKIKTKEKPVLTGIAVGDKIGQGKVKIISEHEFMDMIF